MITATLLLVGLSAWRVTATVSVPNSVAVFRSGSDIALVLQDGMQEIVQFRGRDLVPKESIRQRNEFHAIGSDARGRVVFAAHIAHPTIGEGGMRSQWAGTWMPLLVEGPWAMAVMGSVTWVSNEDGLKYSATDISSWDHVGLDRETGRLAVLRTRKGITGISVLGASGSPLFQHTPLGGSGQPYDTGFPFASIGFLDGDHVVTFLIERPTPSRDLQLLEIGTQTKDPPWTLCEINIKTGGVVPIARFHAELRGDLIMATLGKIAILDKKAIAVLVGDVLTVLERVALRDGHGALDPRRSPGARAVLGPELVISDRRLMVDSLATTLIWDGSDYLQGRS